MNNNINLAMSGIAVPVAAGTLGALFCIIAFAGYGSGFLLIGLLGIIGAPILFLVAQRNQDIQKQRSQLEHSLMQALRSQKNGFDYEKFVGNAGVPRHWANKAAEAIYGRYFDRALIDNVLTEAERRNLATIANLLCISTQGQNKIESKAKEATYRRFVEKSLGDGVLTDAEVIELDALRESLGINIASIANAVGTTGQDAYRALFRESVQDGRLFEDDVQRLVTRSRALGLTEGNQYKVIRDDAFELYRERFCEFKQDGIITRDEIDELTRLQKFLGLSPSDVATYQHEIDRIKMLQDILSGKVPTIKTRKILEGGELCHWDTACEYIWTTPTGDKCAKGEITLTDKRVVFTSDTKSFEFRPQKIIDVQKYSDGARIQTTGSRGSGSYLVSNADAFAATLECIVRKHKFLAADNLSSSRSRHIPDSVKREVWHRDGGTCVRCVAREYLEFDHIIPHTKGGANTVGNIQLLCRKCNSLKSDRI